MNIIKPEKEMKSKPIPKMFSAKILFLAFASTTLICFLIYLLLSGIHSDRISWINSDLDSDGITLWNDLDPDGDGLGIFIDRDGNNDGVENEAQAIAYARSMLNTPDDPLMGKFNDLLGRIGMVVCIDVNLRAYLWAGVPMPALLRKNAKEHPEWFKINRSNFPKNIFFYRRVRNYYRLFKQHPDLETDTKPRPGDWVFYGLTHIAIVNSVEPDGNYDVIEASPGKLRVAISDNHYMEKTWGPPSFFGRIKYGKLEDGSD